MSTIKVTYIETNGVKHEVMAEPGLTLMEVAIQHCVPGIDADCGGACACGTCHIYVPTSLGEKGEIEACMLDLTEDVRPESRLACQITIDPTMEA